MYLNKFKISIFSHNSSKIINILNALKPLEDCVYNIEAITDLSLLSNADNYTLIIIDSSLKALEHFKALKKCHIAFIISEKALLTLPNDILKVIDDLWVIPENTYNKKLITHYFEKTMLLMQKNADYKKMQICFDTAIDSLPDLIWFKDTNGAHLKVNDYFCKTVDKTKQQIYKRGHYYIWDIPQEEYEKGEYVCLESEDIVVNKRKTCIFNEKVKVKDQMRQFKTYKSPLIDSDGEIFGTCGIATDITNLKNVRNELNLLLQSLPFGVITLNENNQITNLNPLFSEMFPGNEDILEKNYDKWKIDFFSDKKQVNDKKNQIFAKIGNESKVFEIYETDIPDIFDNKFKKVIFFSDITTEYNSQKLLLQRQEQIKKIYLQAMQMLAGTIDAKDKYTNGHSLRVAELSREISKRLGIPEKETEDIYYMALLHDIGKIGIPDNIITKASALTEEEYDILKDHTTIGANILKNMSEFPEIATGARWHHERYDGSGYPDGLKGEQIPKAARIICIADSFDAMTSRRSYREVLSMNFIISEIENNKGTQFDPAIANIMLSIIDDIINYRYSAL